MRQRYLYRLIVPLAMALGVGFSASGAQVIKLGYVDMSRVFKNYFKTDAASNDLAEEYRGLQSEIDEQKREIEKLKNEVQTKGNILSDERKNELEAAIRDKFVELRASAQQADNDLRKKTDAKTQAIVREIRQMVQQIGTSEGYTIIFDKAVVLYAAPAFDLTEKVLDELNKNRPAAEPEALSEGTGADEG